MPARVQIVFITAWLMTATLGVGYVILRELIGI
jgi:hypothetical protein